MMENIQEIQDKIFFEAKNALEALAKITTKDELLAKQDLFSEVTDRIAFLRILEKNMDLLVVDERVQVIDNQESNLNFDQEPATTIDEIIEESSFDEQEIEEEVLFTNELNDIDDEEEEKVLEFPTEITAATNIEDEELVVSEKELETNDDEQKEYEERVAQKEKEFRELEERRRKIVEFNKEDVVHTPKAEVFHEEKPQETHSEKKFRLANIKGLKPIQNLFDDDPLEKLNEEAAKSENNLESGSILKTNISTDFMEAEKKKPEFKLDLNDKVAFTKLLFKGKDEDLKAAVEKLNSFDNIEDARQYLSDIYYQNDWSKSDEYAQRLWSLVENKFM